MAIQDVTTAYNNLVNLVGKELEESIVNDILLQVFIRKKQHLLCGWKEDCI
jgi:hypothetical protein